MNSPVRPKMYRNLETGMVRKFWGKPRYGKWRTTTIRHEMPPSGRAAMAKEISARAPLSSSPPYVEVER